MLEASTQVGPLGYQCLGDLVVETFGSLISRPASNKEEEEHLGDPVIRFGETLERSSLSPPR